MVKSMLDLRQLETFSHKKNGSSHDKDRQSVSTEVRMERSLAWGRRGGAGGRWWWWGWSSALMTVLFCSRATKPRDISPGCPCTPARASGIPTEPCGTRRRRRTMPVSGTAGTGTPQPCSGPLAFTLKLCFGQFVSVSVPDAHLLLSNTSGQVEEGQGCRLQWRDRRRDSEESRSPDSACYVSEDSRGSSPDWTLDGELHPPHPKV